MVICTHYLGATLKQALILRCTSAICQANNEPSFHGVDVMSLPPESAYSPLFCYANAVFTRSAIFRNRKILARCSVRWIVKISLLILGLYLFWKYCCTKHYVNFCLFYFPDKGKRRFWSVYTSGNCSKCNARCTHKDFSASCFVISGETLNREVRSWYCFVFNFFFFSLLWFIEPVTYAYAIANCSSSSSL